MPDEILTIRQVADYLQLSQSTIYQLANKGALPGRKVGGSWRFAKSDIDEWLGSTGLVQSGIDILVVEDESPVAKLLVDALTPKGHRVRVAETGEEALSLIQTDSFDLVFLDLHLPGISGIEVYESISHLHRQPQVIVITSFTSSHLLLRALELGLLTVIQKPFRIGTILDAVEKVANAKAGASKFQAP